MTECTLASSKYFTAITGKLKTSDFIDFVKSVALQKTVVKKEFKIHHELIEQHVLYLFFVAIYEQCNAL